MPEDTGRKLDTHRYKNQSQVLCPGMLLMVRCLMRMIRTRYHPGLKFLGRHIHQLLKTLLFVDGLSPHEKRRLCHKYDHRQDGQSAYDAGEDGKGDQEAEKAHGYEIAEKEDKKSHHHRESVIHDPFADGGHGVDISVLQAATEPGAFPEAPEEIGRVIGSCTDADTRQGGRDVIEGNMHDPHDAENQHDGAQQWHHRYHAGCKRPKEDHVADNDKDDAQRQAP